MANTHICILFWNLQKSLLPVLRDPQLISFWYSCHACLKCPRRTCVGPKKVDSPQLCELEHLHHVMQIQYHDLL